MNPAHDLRLVLAALDRGLVDRGAVALAVREWATSGRAIGELLGEVGGVSQAELARLSAIVAREVATGADAGATVSYAEGQSSGAGGARVVGTASGADGGTRFEVLRRRGRGGLGEVYEAHDRELRRPVALKELRPGLAHDPAAQARFVFEAEVTGQLEHPGIVPVYSLGRHADGRPFYAMHLVQGETLRDAIDAFHRSGGEADEGEGGRARGLRRLLRCVIEACNAVAYAHSRGVVHRDLKPENIMLGRFGETRVVDWGMAKRLGSAEAVGGENTPDALDDGDASMTRPGSVVGTPRYMSPEQAAGELERVGVASDVYSLGAVLYAVLVGRDAFPDGGRASVLRRVRRGIFPSPRRLRRSIDPALEAICLKAMALDPSARHGSPLMLAEELEGWLADVRYRGEQEAAVGELKATLARLCVERAQSFFLRDLRGEGMLWLGRALENAPVEPPELSRLARMSLGGWHAGMKLLEKSFRHGGAVRSVAVCPEGRRLATACDDGGARLWDISTGSALAEPLMHTAPVRELVLSGDGTRLATLSDEGAIRCWDATTGAPIGSAIAAGRGACHPRLSWDGSLVAAATGAGLPFLWRAETGEALARSTQARGGVSAICFGGEAGGERVAVGFRNGDACVFAQGGEWSAVAEQTHDSALTAIAIDERRETVATGSLSGALSLWSVDNRRLPLTASVGSEVRWIGFRPGGGAVATLGADGRARLWQSSSGLPLGGPLDGGARVNCLAFRPDGAVLVAGQDDGVIQHWCAATGLPVGPPLRQGGMVVSLAFSGDGRRFATSGTDRLVRCWSTPNEVEGDAERISCWVRVTTELDFDAGDAIRKMDAGTSLELRRRLIDLGGAPLR